MAAFILTLHLLCGVFVEGDLHIQLHAHGAPILASPGTAPVTPMQSCGQITPHHTICHNLGASLHLRSWCWIAMVWFDMETIAWESGLVSPLLG